MPAKDSYQCPWQCGKFICFKLWLLNQCFCVEIYSHTRYLRVDSVGSAESLFQRYSWEAKSVRKGVNSGWRRVDFVAFVQTINPAGRPWSSDGPLDSPLKGGGRVTDIHDPIQPRPWRADTPEARTDEANCWPCMEGGAAFLWGSSHSRQGRWDPSIAVLLASGKWMPLSCGD